ncbi:MAG: YhjD/YihY/BrkB family envelope integrity protein [Bacteroidales bacterium]|nr:YhjD/YihY/BrkB family envelope integrity protein [Bacteroidales bacterium]
MTSLADIKDKMFRQRWILKAERVSKNLILPGFQGLALYEVVVFFVRGLMRGLIIERAKSLSFSFFIALFPSVLFFFSIIPYIPIEGFQQTLMEAIEGFLPPTTFEQARGTIEEIVVRKNGGVLVAEFYPGAYFFHQQALLP